MAFERAEAPKGDGLKTTLDIVVAPKDAFERLRTAPTWGWACAIAIVLLIAGYFMQRSAQLHAAIGTMQHMMATNSLFANMTDAEKQKAIENAAHPGPIATAFGVIGVVVSLFFAVLINSVALLLGNALGRGTASFSQLWAGSMNFAVPTFGLNYLILGTICLILGADHFVNSGDLFRAVPGLAMLFPSSHGFIGAFLFGINVFTLWGFVLNATMLRVVGGVKGAVAWIVPLVVLVGGALLIGSMASFYGG
ncbi:MAG: YIP1 family protein [Candidatus Eremiobacteraeota bacterium]|nr:YIP1 family protein [Candidatus Eremiobacteraeota bacterium]